ncbi:uncharacterized protein (DUF2267 family) [Saccharopolyspora lacisalsi]|uniref:Uncharacterized protein (DUF2267 family) n=1 Tax=Halosaccharopolyspora lacisalsi TaxID=1000566 RepID=A0A839DYD3_9PSEU|nr:DUF2267 domain-containing protein [Halosaccharopolyspora lacisalsi]MBA8824487.1 uncharacterized protein (DUF2267 family) [Halosaccharopolyspora lacisalsi]
MRYEQMIEEVRRRLSVDAGRAETILSAVVQALGEAAATEEMADLRSQLPEPLSSVAPTVPGRDRSLDETVVRVGDLTGAEDADRARSYVDAAFGVVTQAVTQEQLRRVMDTLARDYQQLVPGSVGLDGTDETFARDVRARAEFSSDEQALQVSAAVLSVLSGQITPGQAEELAACLPSTLSRTSLTTSGAVHADTEAVLREISERLGIADQQTALRQTQAVVSVINEWAPAELGDALRQLPTDLTRSLSG